MTARTVAPRRMVSGVVPRANAANDALPDSLPPPSYIPADLIALLPKCRRGGDGPGVRDTAVACGVLMVERAVREAERAADVAPGAVARQLQNFAEAGRAWVEVIANTQGGVYELTKVSGIVLMDLVRPSYAALRQSYALVGALSGQPMPCSVAGLMFAIDTADRLLHVAANLEGRAPHVAEEPQVLAEPFASSGV